MIEKREPLSIYNWEILFDKVSISHAAEKSIPREQRVDPQNPPAEWGPARTVKLHPVDPAYPAIEVKIPEPALPVCHRKIAADEQGKFIGMAFVIGWRVGQLRYIVSVDAETRHVTCSVDNEG